MPRNLPWDRDRATKPKREPNASISASPRPVSTPRRTNTIKRSASTPGSEVKVEKKFRVLKSPSTSPPPEPVTETFMIEGLDEDDKFRMVEDELAYIAGKFTAHLHAAEYHRQKQQAKTRNAETIDSISRPVVARMTPTVRAKNSRLEKTKRRRDGLRRALAKGKGSGLDVESDEEEAPWMGTSLQGLMEAPQGSGSGSGSGVKLSRLASVGPGTKAASGIRPAPGGERARAASPILRAPTFVHRALRAATPVSIFASGHAARDKPPRATAAPPRQVTWPPGPGRSEGATAPVTKAQNEIDIVPILSDSDDDLFASLRRKRREGRAPRGRRGRAQPSSSAAAQDHDRKPEVESDIIPSFL